MVPSTATGWTCRHVLHFAEPLLCIACCLPSFREAVHSKGTNCRSVLWQEAVLCMLLSCVTMAASALRLKHRRALPPAALGSGLLACCALRWDEPGCGWMLCAHSLCLPATLAGPSDLERSASCTLRLQACSLTWCPGAEPSMLCSQQNDTSSLRQGGNIDFVPSRRPSAVPA